VTITVKPDSGYVLDELTVTDSRGNAVKLTNQGSGKYTFTMPGSKVEIAASFTDGSRTSPFADVSGEQLLLWRGAWAVGKRCDQWHHRPPPSAPK
jgi:hypothetical protein